MSTNKKGHTHDTKKGNAQNHGAKGSNNPKNTKKKPYSNNKGTQTPKINNKSEKKNNEKVAPVVEEKNISIVKRTENITLKKAEEPEAEIKVPEEVQMNSVEENTGEVSSLDTNKELEGENAETVEAPIQTKELESAKEITTTPDTFAPETKDAVKNADPKQDTRPNRIDLKNKSEGFKMIIDVALAYEKLEAENVKLSAKNKELIDDRKKLTAESKNLKFLLDEGNKICEQKQSEISNLKAEIEQRNEVIGIVKADKSESEQEFKNALAAALKTYYVDFNELKAMPMDSDVGDAISETFDNFIKVLEKNGIILK